MGTVTQNKYIHISIQHSRRHDGAQGARVESGIVVLGDDERRRFSRGSPTTEVRRTLAPPVSRKTNHRLGDKRHVS